MIKKGEKNGLSTIVATLIIILLVLVAVGILWVVVRNVIQTNAEQVSLGKLTLDLSLERVQMSGNNLSITVKRNAGKGEFVGLSFVVEDGENSEVFTEYVSMNELDVRTFTFTLNQTNPDNIKKIKIVPIFRLKSGKEFVGEIKDTWEKSSLVSEILTCIPNCDGRHCGSNGCDTGNCGTCLEPTPYCDNYQCSEEPCTPSCLDKECGDNGCGTGTCGNICLLPNAVPQCNAIYICEIFSCNTGWCDSDGDRSNGCEAPTGTTLNCGDCGDSCSTEQACSGGICVNQTSCTAHNYSNCYNSDIYWYNSCGVREEPKEDCNSTQSCLNNACVNYVMNWTKYPTWSQYVSIMQAFETNYPTLCHLETIGTSVDGRDIFVVKISDNVNTDEDEPEVFYSSSMHGDETAGYVIMLHLIDYLLQNYSSESRVSNLVNNLEIWINPLANPDGTYTGGEIITSPTRVNSNGVDLNRNYPDPAQPTKVLQKETIDMVNFLNERHFILAASIHSGKEVVAYPSWRWNRSHPDSNWFYSVSRKYVDIVNLYSPDTYMDDLNNGVVHGYEWYPFNGGREDYLVYDLGGCRAIDLKIDAHYFAAESTLNAHWGNNWRSMLGFLEEALYGIHGTVTDATTSLPVSAKVSITGHDADNSHVYSNNLTGRFIRLIEPGTWALTFSANGYYNTTINNVIVVENQRTDVSVEMQPVV